MNIIDSRIRKFLDSMSEGSIFRLVIGNFLIVIAVLNLVVGIFFWLYAFGEIFDDTFVVGIGTLVFQVFALGVIFLISNIIWIRAEKVKGLEPGPFTLIPIFAVILRLVGEILFVSLLLLSIPSMVAIWFGAAYFVSLFVPWVSPFMGGFFGGVSVGLAMGIAAFVWLAILYFIAETIEVLYRMAIDIRGTRLALERSAVNASAEQTSAAGSMTD